MERGAHRAGTSELTCGNRGLQVYGIHLKQCVSLFLFNLP